MSDALKAAIYLASILLFVASAIVSLTGDTVVGLMFCVCGFLVRAVARESDR